MNLDKNLRYYREQAGYKTAKEFADILNIPYNTYTAYENQKREPKLEMLIKIADLLNISLDDLVGRTIKTDNLFMINLINNAILELKEKNIIKKNVFLCSNDIVKKINIDITNHDKKYYFCVDYENCLNGDLSSEKINSNLDKLTFFTYPKQNYLDIINNKKTNLNNEIYIEVVKNVENLATIFFSKMTTITLKILHKRKKNIVLLELDKYDDK